jgi:V/A-type H+-transporting ATPase subunit I
VYKRQERSNLDSALKKTRYASRITGWVEQDRIAELKDILTLRCKERFHIDNRPPNREEIDENSVPTSLKNVWLGRMFEPLTNTFAVPKYNEIDPSLWISIPFILFFGLMLGDAGYGLLIMAISSFLVLFSGRSDTLRMTGWMGFLMGLSTTVSGIWMGAFFGDLIPRVFLGRPGSPLFTFDLFGYSMPYDTLKDPMLLFQVSLYIGLIQLNLGIILKGIDRIVKKDLFGFFKSTVSWFLIQLGGVIFVGALLIGWWELDTLLTSVGAISFMAGSILLAFEAKGMVLFNIEGYVGDWISYTRILALGLSTFGLAMAFNIVGRMLVDASLAMLPVVILLLVFLHIFNLLLQALGAAVHSLRLQFVEFFGRFYEGGGRTFEPFGMERVHTREPPLCSPEGGDDAVC